MGWEVRTKPGGAVVYYYEGPKIKFGGPWNNPNKFEQVSVPDNPTPNPFRTLAAIQADLVGASAADIRKLNDALFAQQIRADPDFATREGVAIPGRVP